jgi:hypothetical protein
MNYNIWQLHHFQPIGLLYIFLLNFCVQIENEYESVSKVFGSAGNAYMTWAAKMAVGMGTGVPWVMCKEDDAPDPVVLKIILLTCFLASTTYLLMN